MTVKLGINPLTWTNDDMPALGAETSLETCLEEGREAGFSGFELGNKFPRDPRILGPLLSQRNLELVSGWYSGGLLTRTVDEEKKAIQKHLDLLKALGAEVMVFCEVTDCIHGYRKMPVSARIPFPAKRWDEYAEKLNELAEYTLSQGVQIAYHHHMGTVIQTEQEVDELMRRTSPAVGLLLDTGHLLYAGGDSLKVAQRWGQRIVHVHCKDIRMNVLADSKNRNLSFLDSVLNGVFTVPGDGGVDYAPVFEVLKSNGYKGWLVVEAEQDPAIAHPLTYAQLGYKNLHRLARSAQLI